MFDFALAIPEVFIFVAICILAVLNPFCRKSASLVTYLGVQLALLIAFALSFMQYGHPTETTFSGSYILDNLSVILKLFIALSAFFSLLYARPFLRKANMIEGDYYLLALFSVMGMFVLVSAYSLITLFIGLELFSLPLYAMIALEKEREEALEAAIKYFVIGSLASALLLYGFSMLYGASHTLNLANMQEAIATFPHTQFTLFSFSMVFVLVALTFKIGAVPFHMWVPDVYEGGSTPVVLFLGSVGKIAASVLLLRLLPEIFSSLGNSWRLILIIVAVSSMALGNLGAIAQENIKRMLGYSSIAHMGYFLLGLIAGTPDGYSSSLFYMLTYALMTLSALGLVGLLNQSGYWASNIEDLKGLNSRHPWFALMFLLTFFSLAGMPPLLGFMAKLAVLQSLIRVDLVWLAALALLFAIIGSYYYIRVIKTIYFDPPLESKPFISTEGSGFSLSLNGLALLIMGMVPGFLFAICGNVFK